MGGLLAGCAAHRSTGILTARDQRSEISKKIKITKIMFGKLLGTAIRVATLPVDAANAGMDILTGGNGTKKSRNFDDANPLSALELLRDRIAETAEELDD